MYMERIINYVQNTSININWQILKNMIFSWKKEEIKNETERLAGLLFLNNVKKYIDKNKIINLNVFKQLLLDIEEVIEISD